MNTLTLSLLVGLVVAILDIIPMLLKKLNGYACASAAAQYVLVAVVVFHITLPIPWWLLGGVVSLAMAVPVLIIVAQSERKSLPIIASNALVLGTLIGIAKYALL